MFDGSTDQVPASEEDAMFYKRSIEAAVTRGYARPFVVVTKIDIVESRLRKKYANAIVDDKQKEFLIAEHIDGIVTGLAQKLGLPRDQIDFLENYTVDNHDRNLKIEYYLLKTFKKIVDEAQRFVQLNSKDKWCRVF